MQCVLGGGVGELYREKDQRLRKEPLILLERRADIQEWTITVK